jgi:hypothetical protein
MPDVRSSRKKGERCCNKIMCFVGIHSWEKHPDSKTAEELGELMGKARDGLEVFGYLMAGHLLVGLERCKYCPKERNNR